ncbi:hypothetical protein L3Q82_014472 [Scortum barcoo]|uniref:Uncharacterized protein n=1 Tax=Scortum barcoo TaxID=214431 RepID=A0ACB8VX14_9TELE|nr:hypothetical protein L3Q82_014472 [Scortum barcoo]
MHESTISTHPLPGTPEELTRDTTSESPRTKQSLNRHVLGDTLQPVKGKSFSRPLEAFYLRRMHSTRPPSAMLARGGTREPGEEMPRKCQAPWAA